VPYPTPCGVRAAHLGVRGGRWLRDLQKRHNHARRCPENAWQSSRFVRGLRPVSDRHDSKALQRHHHRALGDGRRGTLRGVGSWRWCRPEKIRRKYGEVPR